MFNLYLDDKKVFESTDLSKIQLYIDDWKKNENTKKIYNVKPYNRIIQCNDRNPKHLLVDFGSYRSFFKIIKDDGDPEMYLDEMMEAERNTME